MIDPAATPRRKVRNRARQQLRVPSSMCRSRITSFSFILESGRGHDLIPKVAAEVARGPQVDFVPRFFGKFLFHADYVEK